MSIDFNPADFTPQLAGYTGQGAFRFWCQKVLPIVYDDSLSYYELLNKVVVYLNNVISDVAATETNVTELYNAYNNLQSFVNDFFENLSVDEEINNKLDTMAENGTLTDLIAPLMPAIITDWLNTHITPTSPPVDNTLTIAGAAADSKATGERIALVDRKLSSFNAENLLVYGRHSAAPSGYGITATWNADGSCTIEGTNSTAVGIRLWYVTDDLPSWIKPGETYYLVNPSTDVRLQIECHDETDVIAQYITLDNDNIQPFTVPEETTNVLIQLRVLAGTHDVTITPTMLSGDTNANLSADVARAFEELEAQNTRLNGQSNMIANIIRTNAINIVYYCNHLNLTDYYGLNVSWTDKYTCVITGTNASVAGVRLWPNTSDFPEWLNKGSTYYLKNPAPNIRLQVACYDSGSNIIAEYTTLNNSKVQPFTIPANTDKIMIQLRVLTGTHNDTVEPKFESSISDSEQTEKLLNIQENYDGQAKYSVRNVLSNAIRNNVTNSNGISAVWNEDGSCHITGTNSSATGIRMWLNTSNLIPWLEPGGTYYLKHRSSEIQFNIVFYNGDTIIQGLLFTEPQLITVPSNTTNVLIQLRVLPGTHDVTVNPVLLTDISGYLYGYSTGLSVAIDDGVIVTDGDLTVALVKKGYNSLIDFRNALWKGASLFYGWTDWIGPYDFEAVNNADGDRLDPTKGVASTPTTGGNHNIHTGDPATGTPTARTIEWKVYADNKDVTDEETVSCSKLKVMWVNRVQAGNTAKLAKDADGYGTGRECLEEHCYAEFLGGGLIKVGVTFKPLEDIDMRWYSGLQYAGWNFASDVYIPEYSNDLINIGYLDDNRNAQTVQYMKAVGDVMSMEMFLNREYGCGKNQVPYSVSGGSNGVGQKAYYILFSRDNTPVRMNANELYSWCGYYRYEPTV